MPANAHPQATCVNCLGLLLASAVEIFAQNFLTGVVTAWIFWMPERAAILTARDGGWGNRFDNPVSVG